MPYVEIWVDEPELHPKQIKAIADLVKIVRRVAWQLRPRDEAEELERSADKVARAIPELDDRNYTAALEFPADKKYREWQEQQAASITAIGSH
jgi:hypothetical protein